jgi:hypothetical protein
VIICSRIRLSVQSNRRRWYRNTFQVIQQSLVRILSSALVIIIRALIVNHQSRRIPGSLRLGDSIRGVLGSCSTVARHAAAIRAHEAVRKAAKLYEGVPGSGADAFGSSGIIACTGKRPGVKGHYEYFE